MYKALFLSPMVPSTDVFATTEFLRQALGFHIRMIDSYAICEKDGLTIHLQPAGTGVGEMAIYLEVDDIEQVWSQLQPHVEGIRHKEPFDREYGMREIHVDLPFTQALLFIGQATPK
jgi:hypothetical protein